MTESALVWILAALAATRWTTLLTRDSFGPIRRIREWVLFRWPDDDTEFGLEYVIPGDPDPMVGELTNPNRTPVRLHDDGWWRPVESTPVGTLVSCARCMSVWAGSAALVVLAVASDVIAAAVFAPFAFSQVAITLIRAD